MKTKIPAISLRNGIHHQTIHVLISTTLQIIYLNYIIALQWGIGDIVFAVEKLIKVDVFLATIFKLARLLI